MLENWESWTHEKNLSSKNQCKRSIDHTKGEEVLFPIADGKRLRIPRTHSKAGTNLLGVKISMENFKANRGPQLTETKDDAEAQKDFWSIQGDFIYRHHKEPRVQPYVSKEETDTWKGFTKFTLLKEKPPR